MGILKKMYRVIALLSVFSSQISADAPVNCPVSASWGDWEFRLGERSNSPQSLLRGIVDENGDYTNLGEETGKPYRFSFELYNKVTDLETGATGVITSIYNQGFQFEIYGQKWFVYYYFKTNEDTGNTEFSCEKTSVGWAVDDNLREYVRIYGHHLQNDVKIQISEKKLFSSKKYVHDEDFIKKVNQKNNKLWTAEHNAENEKYTISQLQKRSGTPTTNSKPQFSRNMTKLVET